MVAPNCCDACGGTLPNASKHNAISLASLAIPSTGIDARLPITIPADEVREYCDGKPVEIEYCPFRENLRIVVIATNEGGYNSTQVDLLDLINWVAKNLPELMPPAPEDT